MQDLPTMDALRAILEKPLDPNLHKLLADRLSDTLHCCMQDHTHVIVIETDDTEEQIIDAIGFSPLRSRIDNLPDRPDWDWMERHGNWIELLFCIGDSGHAVIAFLQDDPRSPFAAYCRKHEGCA